MPLVVGIDEAGYGPTLGPLVVGATLWNVPPRLVRDDYWQLLQECVSRSATRGQACLTVNDSKIVYQRQKGLSTLERPVLAFASAVGLDCTTVEALLTSLDVQLETTAGLPWYRELSRPLPIDPRRSQYAAVAERLQRHMARAGVMCCGLLAEIVTEDRFNQRVAATRNKAAVLIEQVLRLIQAAAKRAGDQDLVVRVDRLGGRSDYRRLLALAFAQRHVQILEVSPERSRYRLACGESSWFIEFAVDSDRLHLPVALASMVAKYLREVLMAGFNAYWQRRLPKLRPTAGYYTDARRFLSEIEAVVSVVPVPRERFVRSR